MAYRSIDVDGKTYQYTVGRTHLKIKGFEAIPVNRGRDRDDKLTVTPLVVAETIRLLVAG